MPSIQRPFGFTMADNEYPGGRHPGGQQLLTPQLGLILADSERQGLGIGVVERKKLVAQQPERKGGFILRTRRGN
jgi:hypothetical protein